MVQMVLSVNQISKQYGSLHVLKNVSLEVEKGQFVTIIGASGAGKSTLLHIMGTLDKADSGSVIMDGIDLCTLNKKEQSSHRNKKMGFVFQFHHLLPEFTALENVCMPVWIGGRRGKEVMEDAKKLLVHLGLSERLNHKPSQLSGGEQQRVAIARALIQQPSILFADEPTGNLDTDNASAIHQLFLNIKNEYGITIIVVTHNDELARLSDRVVTMKDGNIISDVKN